jgi:repressor of nif and glnA expression
VIHDEEGVPEKFFVAQPVLRTQFLPTVSEGSLTSFNNISTVMVNRGYEEHVDAIRLWLNMLEEKGFDENDISVKVSRNKNRWG